MDHHCPWFNNCVSFSTHKSFLLTLAYGSVLAAFTALTALIPAASAWLSLGLSFTALNVSCVVAGGAYLSIAVAAFMCVQLGYLYRNVTTLENMRPTLFREQTDSFDLGRKKNVLQLLIQLVNVPEMLSVERKGLIRKVFGTDRLLWPFPVHTSQGDGSRYPTKLHPNPYDLRLPLVQKNKPVPPASTEAKPTGKAPLLVLVKKESKMLD
ncbi:hypothetical protein HPB48_026338 [Haemaphysalis longicornis]|uniref:Palmitoyltransferase n=1 Tax=Haemaphysalis longicornis TaxID=44386 RepID=A0A9J6HBS1_HAELO|nr:hypothetical protein HPB48_026338 [Haemaphysalis longicornis]